MDWACSLKARSNAALENRKMLKPLFFIGWSSQRQKSEVEPNRDSRALRLLSRSGSLARPRLNLRFVWRRRILLIWAKYDLLRAMRIRCLDKYRKLPTLRCFPERASH